MPKTAAEGDAAASEDKSCYLCGVGGKHSATCPKRLEKKSKSAAAPKGCFICSMDSHKADQCPTPGHVQKEFDALIAKRKSGKGGFSLQLYTELLGRVSACLDFNAACFLLECLKKDALPLGDEVWQHVQRMLARSRHDRSAVRGIPKIEAPIEALQKSFAEYKHTASVTKASSGLGPVLEFLRKPANLEEAKTIKNRFKFASWLSKGLHIPAKEARDVVAVLNKQGKLVQKSSGMEVDLDAKGPKKSSEKAAGAGKAKSSSKKSKKSKKGKAKKEAGAGAGASGAGGAAGASGSKAAPAESKQSKAAAGAKSSKASEQGAAAAEAKPEKAEAKAAKAKEAKGTAKGKAKASAGDDSSTAAAEKDAGSKRKQPATEVEQQPAAKRRKTKP